MTKARDLANASTALSAVSATELAFVDGVTSAIQTQMDAKAPSSTAVTLTGTQTLTNKTLTNPVIASVINNTLTSTTGDIIYASAANTPARLGIGSSAQVLTVASGIPSWATPAASGATLDANTFTADQSINGIIAGRSGGNIASNTAFGSTALDSNTTGANNVAVGINTLTANTTGTWNVAVGVDVLKTSTTARGNTGVGYKSLEANTSGEDNTALGFQALKVNTTGTSNVAIGGQALVAATTANNNTVVGMNAAPAVTTGANNVAIGQGAFYSTTTGAYNVAVGYASMQAAGNPEGATAIGNSALYGVIGNNNTALGNNAGANLDTGANNTLIGYNAQPTSAGVSNTITLGNSSIATLRCQVTSITALSDERDKKNIEPLNVGLEFVNTLKPVTFDWNMRSTTNREGDTIPGGKVDIPDTGFIAQDIIAAEETTTIADHLQLSYRDNPDALEITQGRLIPILVKAIQDLSAKVAALEANA